MAERAGRRPRPACARSSCRPSGSSSRTSRTRTWWRSAAPSPGRALGAAPQRHLPLGGRRGLLDARSPASSRRRSASPSPRIPHDPKTAWFVPAVKDEMRYPAGGQVVVTRTRDGGQHVRDRSRTACRSSTPTTSSTATRSTWTTPAAARLRLDDRLALWFSDDGGDSLADGVGAPAAGLRRAFELGESSRERQSERDRSRQLARSLDSRSRLTKSSPNAYASLMTPSRTGLYARSFGALQFRRRRVPPR